MKNSVSNNQYIRPGRREGYHENFRLIAPALLALVVFCLPGCSFGLLEGYRKAENSQVTPVSWFKADSDHFLMNTSIDVMKNHFSGLMVIKPIQDSGYRAVCMTEVGLKIFDLGFISGKPVQVHYIMDALNRKVIIKTLAADMKLMLVQPVTGKEPVVYYSPPPLKMVKYRQGRKRDFYEVSSLSRRPVHAWKVTRISKKARIDYYSADGAKIDSVTISHYHLRLRIAMHLINENSPDATE